MTFRHKSAGHKHPQPTKKRSILFRAVISFLLLLYLAHGFLIWSYAINIPYWDEWLFITPGRYGNLATSSFLEFTFSPLWESRISWTMLEIWFLSKADGWNFIHMTLLNYLIFGGIIVLIFNMLKCYLPDRSPYIPALLILPLLTPWFWEGHGWAIQSHVHFSTLFFMLTIHTAFDPQQRNSRVLSATAFGLLGIFAWGRGAVCIGTALIFWNAWKILRLNQILKEKKPNYRRELMQWFGFSSALILALALYFLGPGSAFQLGWKSTITSPFSKSFWSYFLVNTTTMFGLMTPSIAMGIFCFMLILSPLIITLLRARGRLSAISTNEWRIVTIICGALVAMAALTGARGNLPIETASSPRYSFANGLIFPFVVALLLQNYSNSLRLSFVKECSIAAVLMTLILGYASTVDKNSYRDFYWQRKMEGFNCLTQLVKTNSPGEWRCESLYFGDLKPAWEAAQALKLSFTEDVMREAGLATR